MSAAEILDSVTDAVYAFDRDWRITYVNAAGEVFARAPRDELLGQVVWERFPSLVGGPYERAYRNAMEHRTAQRLDAVYFEALDVWTSVHVFPAPDGVIASIHDMTEVVRAEAARSESEARWHAMVQNAADPITVLGTDGSVRHASPAFARLLGYDPGELADIDALAFIHPDDEPRIRLEFVRLVTTPGSMANVEFRYRHKSGHWVLLAVTAHSLLHDPAVAGIVCNTRDVTQQRALEENLRASERRARAMFEANPLPAFAWERRGDDFCLTDFNEAGALITKGKVSEFLGITARELYADSPEIVRMMEDVAHEPDTQGRNVELDYVVRSTREHRRFKVHVTAPTKDLLIVHADDLTERRQAEVLFRGLAEQSITGIYVAQDGRLTYVNPRLAEILGRTPDELRGAPYEALAHECSIPEVRRQIQRRAESPGATSSYVIKARRKDGAIVDLEIFGSTIEYEGRPAQLGTVIDITERRRSDEVLRLQASLLDAVQEAVIATDAHGVLTYWNRAAEVMYGWNASEVIGKQYRELGIHENAEELEALVRALHEGNSVRGDRHHRHRDGRRLLVTASASPVYDAHGAIAGMVGVCSDIADRRRAEEERLDLANHVRLLLESTTQGVYGMDANGCITFMNGAGAALLGYAPSEMIGKEAHALFHHSLENGTRVPYDECAINRAFTRHESVRVDHDVFWRRDGDILPVSYSASPVVVAGEVTGAVVAFTDETSRRAAERALHEREENLAALVAIQQEVATSDLDFGRMTQLVAERALTLTGAEGSAIELLEGDEMVHCAVAGIADRYIGLRLDVNYSLSGTCVRTLEVLRSDDAMADPRVNGEARHKVGVRSLVVTPLVHDGRAIGVLKVMSGVPGAFGDGHVRTLRLLGGLLGAGIGRSLDLQARETLAAQRAAALEALREREAHFRSLIENASDAVVIVNARGTLTYASPAFARILGHAPTEALGRELDFLLHPDDLASVRSLLARVNTNADVPLSGEFRVQHADGGYRVLAWTARNLLDDPAVGGIVVNLRDMSEQKLLEERLRQAQKMEAVGQLAGGVAHDFNNLLTVITANLEFIRQDLPEDHPVRGDVDEIAGASQRARSLVRQLLTFSRKQPVRPQHVRVGELVSGAEKLLRRLIGEEIVLDVAVEESETTVLVDPGELEQVLMNLAVNARDAMLTPLHGHDGNGGTLTIETGDVVLTAAEASEHEVTAGRWVRIRVRDTGHGIAPATQVHIFEPFFTTKEVGVGTGLGLATVFGIVKQAGGTVRVESAAGAGATFTILLPSASSDGAELSGSRTSGPARATRATVLLVEDERAVRISARRILERRGYTVLEARHGADALLVWREHRDAIDAVVTDLRMPELGGRELVTILRGDAPELPVVFVSGYSEQSELTNQHPREAHVDKPFTADSLLASLERLLAR